MRGLKLCVVMVEKTEALSHPSWVRGLKPVSDSETVTESIVAPLVGAWIETVPFCTLLRGFWRRTPRGCVD